MDKEELYVLLSKTEKQAERAKLKRATIAILVYAAAIFLFFYITGNPKGFDIVGDFLAALFLSAINFLVNSVIFGQLFRMSEAENRRIAELEKQLSEKL